MRFVRVNKIYREIRESENDSFVAVAKFEEVGEGAEHHPMHSFHQSSPIAFSQKHTVALVIHCAPLGSSPDVQHQIIEDHTSESDHCIAANEQGEVIFKGHRMGYFIAEHVKNKPEIQRNDFWL